MGPGDLAPDHPDLGAANLLLSLVDIRNLLAEIEAIQAVSRHVPFNPECKHTWRRWCRQHPRS